MRGRRCSRSPSSAFDTSRAAVPAGGVLGEWRWRRARRAYLNRTGAAILLLTLLALVGDSLDAVLVRPGVQRASPSACAASAGCSTRWREWREERRRDRERQQIVDKHVKKAGRENAPEIATQGRRRRREAEGGARDAVRRGRRRGRGRRRARGARRGRQAAQRAGDPAARRPSPPPLPLGDRRHREGARRAAQGRLRAAARDAARRAEGPAQDRRARADGRARGCSKRSAASSPSKARSSRFTRARSSRPTSSSPTPA